MLEGRARHRLGTAAAALGARLPCLPWSRLRGLLAVLAVRLSQHILSRAWLAGTDETSPPTAGRRLPTAHARSAATMGTASKNTTTLWPSTSPGGVSGSGCDRDVSSRRGTASGSRGHSPSVTRPPAVNECVYVCVFV